MSTPGFPQDADEAMNRVKELSDRMIELTQKNGVAWLEAYEKVLDQMVRLQERAAASTQIEWINALTAANAEFMREMSSVYFRTAREQLK
jgi:beta-galactosidase/beta-glucuronidase